MQETKTKTFTISHIASHLQAKTVCCPENLKHEVDKAFASDLMSDVLTLESENLLLITGLANSQAIRTCEMSDIGCMVLVRGKKATPDMLSLARQLGIVILESEKSMFRVAGELFMAGIKPIF